MRTHASHAGALLVLACLACLPWAQTYALEVVPQGPVNTPGPQPKPLVQLAILLDTSGSMSGLIDQARIELWSIVNQFIAARQNGAAPEVQVALFEYGNNGLAREVGWIRQIVAFTTDLDRVSQELFSLKTNGGDEYCGWVIKEAVEKLQWSAEPNSLKVVFIAGNEPFTQGPVNYRDACKAAIEKGIVVNTLHCGSEQEGVDGQWNQGASLADGQYVAINHNQQVVHIAAPQDAPLAALNSRLNETYVPFGLKGEALSHRQSTQDLNASTASPEAAAQRAVAKASANYVNSDWDLVDAVTRRQVDLSKIEDSQLPQALRGLSPEEKKSWVEAKSKQRSQIQAEIQTLSQARQHYVAEQQASQKTSDKTLGSAIVSAIRRQAAAKRFEFVKPTSEETRP